MTTSFSTGESPLRATKLNLAFSERVLKTGDTMTGELILPGDPVNMHGAATKGYVDAHAGSGGGGGYAIGQLVQGPSPSILTDLGHGLLIPGYVYPNNPYSDVQFQNLLTIMRKYYDVPVIYIINPGDGPGTLLDGNYAAAIRLLHGAGAAVVGYVATGYAARDPALVRADVDTWTTLYADSLVDGIFFDEMTYELGVGNANVTLYQGYCSYVHAKGLPIVIGNPGANQQGTWYLVDPPSADIIVMWETFTYPLITDLYTNFTPHGHVDYSWKRQSVMVHSQPFTPAEFRQMKKYVKWLWATDDTFNPAVPVPPDDNPYDEWPTYLEQLFAVCRPDPWASMLLNFPQGYIIPNHTSYFTYDAPYAGIILTLTRFSITGSYTLSIQIDGVTVTGLSALSVNNTTQVATATALNTFAVGSKITAVISGATGSPTASILSLNMMKFG